MSDWSNWNKGERSLASRLSYISNLIKGKKYDFSTQFQLGYKPKINWCDVNMGADIFMIVIAFAFVIVAYGIYRYLSK